MDYETIKVDVSNRIATVTLNLPDKLNVISLKMIDELIDCFDRLEREGEARVIVFTGEGRAFCAGASLDDLQKTMNAGLADMESMLRQWFVLVWRMSNIDLPTIAAVNGVALGGGFAFALACDIRVASEDARAGSVFVQRGASSADMGVSWILPRVVGAGWAAELMFTGDIIDAATAEKIGLFNHVYPRGELLDGAGRLAAKLAAGPPIGLKFTKRALRRSIWEGLQGQLGFEAAHQTLVFNSDDLHEGVNAFFEKRTPEFKGR